MTTPLGPVEPEPTGATPVSPDVPTPAPGAAPTTQDVNDMVAGLYKQVLEALPKDPFRKGTITAINTGTPSTIDIVFPAPTNTDGSAGTPVTVPGIRFIDSFSPVVGDTVILGQVGTDVFGIGQITNTPAPSSSTNGWVAVGNTRYRKVIDNGDWKVQLQGSWSVGGNSNLFVLPSDYKPNADREFVVSSNSSMGFSRIHVSFSSGQVSLINGFTATDNGGTGSTSSVDPADSTTYNDAGWTDNRDAGWTDTRLSGYLSQAGSDLGHAHYTGSHAHYTGSHNHGIVGAHSHSGPNHNHTITPAFPGTVWFDSIEFFL